MTRDHHGQGYRFATAGRVAHEFEQLLNRYGLAPTPGSCLERMTLNIFDVLYHRQHGFELAEQDVRTLFSDLSGLVELAARILRISDMSDFEQLIPHLRLLNTGEASQNRRAPQTDQAANKIFELLVACWAMRCGSKVVVDHPTHATGSNPDVLATIRGRRWGIACKVLHSLHPESLIENISRGLEQIDRSPAEVGFVLLNLKNVLNRDRYWSLQNPEQWVNGAEPVFNTFTDPDIPKILLQGEVRDIVASIRQHVGGAYIRRRFAKSRSLPGVVLYAHVMSGVLDPERRPVPMSQRWLTWAEVGPIAEDDDAVLKCLNRMAQETP